MDVHSSSPARTPKLQLANEQLLTGECWTPPKKDMPYRSERSPRKTVGGAKPHLVSHPMPTRDAQKGSNETFCAPVPRDPTETEPGWPLGVWVSPVEAWFSHGLLQGQRL